MKMVEKVFFLQDRNSDKYWVLTNACVFFSSCDGLSRSIGDCLITVK